MELKERFTCLYRKSRIQPSVFKPKTKSVLLGYGLRNQHSLVIRERDETRVEAMYVEAEPDEPSEGKVSAAGVASSEHDAEGELDCIVGVLKGMKVPSPGEHAAKVMFSL